MLRIAVLASGSGSNAEKLYNFFLAHRLAEVKMLVTNTSKAGVIDRFSGRKVNVHVFEPNHDSEKMLIELVQGVDIILLAGYTRKIPESWIRAFNGRMLNIHPSLLPKFGGKGMYGRHVHKAVSLSGDNKTGVTIHLVNEEYDEGAIIAQFAVEIQPGEAPKSIETKVRRLELEYYGPTVERWIENLILSQ